MRAAALVLLAAGGAAAQAPSYDTRQQALRAVVQVTATDCADGRRRVGTGFAFESPSRIVTAHHVVGGCRAVQVNYEAIKPPASSRRPARVVRVLASGDLSLLQIDQPPAVPALRLAGQPPGRNERFAGIGYPLGQPTAGDVEVSFSIGSPRLSDILPAALNEELAQAGSAIATEREVLRFNVALQPGMSGGPIVNTAGEVIGIVAGGLKAGAAPASWGWPGDGLRALLASTEPTDRPVRGASAFYSFEQLDAVSRALAQARGRTLRCGALDFTDTGTRPLGELLRGADDMQRFLYLVSISGESTAALAGAPLRVWVHTPSGATALVPADASLVQEGARCIARSADGNFQQVVWGAAARDAYEHGLRSAEFERQVVNPLLPRHVTSQLDPTLTTFQTDRQTGQTMPGPLMRDSGLAFARKGASFYKRMPQFYGERVPEGHAFESMVASAGQFLGVATVNQEVDPAGLACLQGNGPPMGCIGAERHRKAWTRFVLATQLSTFPSF